MKLPSQPPIGFDHTAESLLDSAQAQIQTTKYVWDHLVATVDLKTAKWDNTILPIIQDENRKLSASRYLCFYKSTSPDENLRNASNAVSGLFDDAEMELYGRPDMFALVDVVKNNLATDAVAQDAESRYYLEKLHRKFTQNGCGLEDVDAKARFMQCQRRIKEIERQCNKNHHDESTKVFFTPDDLVGVPESFLSRLTSDEGGFWVSTKVAQSSPILRQAKKESTRKKIFYAIQNKMPANIPLFRELILLRDEAARLLGYPNHAALRIRDKMMGSPEAVSSMLQDIEAGLVPEGAKDVSRLLEIKRAEAVTTGELDAEEHPEHVFLWDVSYLAHIQDQQEKSTVVDVTEYYELHHTLQKLLGIFKHIFGVEFLKISSEEQVQLGAGKPLVWHNDVLMYAVWDRREDLNVDAFLGYAYLDLHPRQGKYTHSGHYSLQPVSPCPLVYFFHVLPLTS